MTASKLLRVCQKCGALCCKVGGSTFTKKEMKSVLDAGFENYFLEVKDGFFELKTNDGVCTYLNDDNFCKIQAIKPIVCVCHPVFPSFKKEGGYSMVECPLAKVLTKKEIDRFKNDANKVSKELLDVVMDWGTIKDEKERNLVMKKWYDLGKMRELE